MTSTLTGFLLLAQDGLDRGDGHMDFDDGWWIVMLLFWGLVIVGVVWAIKAFTERRPAGEGPSAGAEAPNAILERRLAEGAISVEEYEERRRVLAGAESEEPPG